jgi:opacity protein-like surface antigen
MRTIRGLAIAIAALALVPQVGSAQLGRRFENAWFWGAKGGLLVYSTVNVANAAAPVFGAEWVITRKNGGLYISVDHAIMTEYGQYVNADMLPDTTIADMELKDIRRYNFAAMVFPDIGRWIRPYVGLGASMTQVARATNRAPYASTDEELSTEGLIAEYKATLSPLSIVGVQLRLPLASVFAQATAMQTPQRFFLRGSNSFTYSLEAGVRYNVGSSIGR